LRTIVAILSGGALLLKMTALIAPTSALPEPEVSAKLDTILLLMAVVDKGQPHALRASVDGRSVSASLAAISIAAAEAITAGQLRVVPSDRLASLIKLISRKKMGR
jgi:hypothetical protein